MANGPNDYGLISKSIFDLTNDVRDETFDPDDFHSPLNDELDESASSYENDVPFAPVQNLFVNVSFNYAMADGYIAGIITVMLEVQGWVANALNAAPLVIHSLFHPIDPSDPLPRDESISKRKWDA